MYIVYCAGHPYDCKTIYFSQQLIFVIDNFVATYFRKIGCFALVLIREHHKNKYLTKIVCLQFTHVIGLGDIESGKHFYINNMD